MLPLIEHRLPELHELCTSCKVKQLELFGSAATGRFEPTTSDLDFLVEFQPLQPSELADAYLRLLVGLEAMFERRIDLVTKRSLTNPYFIQAIKADRQVLYAA